MRHPTFAAHQGTSYFAIELGEWIVLGLDSAYYAEPPWMYDGRVGDKGQEELLHAVREQIDKTGQKVSLLTHHHALMADGKQTTPLWDEIVSDHALGRPPDVWYYGHYHAAAVYSPHSAAGPKSKVRVMGHGSIPFSAPAEVAENAGPGKPIEIFAHTPYGDDVAAHRGRVMNVFRRGDPDEQRWVERAVPQPGRVEHGRVNARGWQSRPVFGSRTAPRTSCRPLDKASTTSGELAAAESCVCSTATVSISVTKVVELAGSSEKSRASGASAEAHEGLRAGYPHRARCRVLGEDLAAAAAPAAYGAGELPRARWRSP